LRLESGIGRILLSLVYIYIIQPQFSGIDNIRNTSQNSLEFTQLSGITGSNKQFPRHFSPIFYGGLPIPWGREP
jgi:hypothetical protein